MPRGAIAELRLILSIHMARPALRGEQESWPFCEHGLADFRIIEFRASQRSEDVQKRIDNDRSA
ncbi:MAG TPA: hypothetical protein VIL97_02360 [Thermoanaerobaculia bacterium]